jgi:3-dehydroquinate synthase
LERIIIKSPESVSAIIVGARWEAVSRLLPSEGVVILTDKNVYDIFGSRFPDFPVMIIEPGEKSKRLGVLDSLAGRMLKKGIDRSGFILAIGGGVVSDVAGFLASVYLRGIRCGYVSTTLLSQVDASTGGKNGVNLGSVKNVLGTFRQPEFVVCDTTMLRSLPENEYLSGIGELIKTGLIGDPSIIEILETRHADLILRDRKLLSDLVSRSVKFKASVVASDEKEKGYRRILNFGHTFGHAIELSEHLEHGIAVACGMEVAARFSLHKGLTDMKTYGRIRSLLEKYNLLRKIDLPASGMKKFISHDKKKAGSEINFVFIRDIGKPVVKKIPIQEAIEFYSGTGKKKKK